MSQITKFGYQQLIFRWGIRLEFRVSSQVHLINIRLLSEDDSGHGLSSQCGIIT